MKVLVDVVDKLKVLDKLKKNNEPTKKLFKILGKWLYTDLPLIRGEIRYSIFWKNKMVGNGGWTILNINKNGEMWYDGGRKPTLSNIIDTLENALKNGYEKYYSNEDVRRLSLVIKNITREDK